MEQRDSFEQKTAIALKVINFAKERFGSFRYRTCPTDHVIASLLSDFKRRFVFSTKEYNNCQQLYNKGAMSWENLKSTSEKIFREQLLECKDTKIDAFFELRRR